MSQHDYIIANAAGAAVRTDLNNALGAIVTLNAGGSAPTTTYAYMLWADTDSGLLKMRNAANNAWITIGLLAGFKLDDWFAPDDNTDLNASISAHGLCPKAPDDATKFLRGDGPSWATPPTMTPATNFQSYSKTIFGNGSDGNVIITENTVLPDSGIGVRVKQYNNLTINEGIYLAGHSNDKVLVLLVKGTLTINGQIYMTDRGGLGGAGRSDAGAGNPGGAGAFGGGGGPGSNYRGGGGGGGGQPGDTAASGTGFGGGKFANVSQPPSNPFSLGVGYGGDANYQTAYPGVKTIANLLNPLMFEIARYLYGAGGGGGGRDALGTSGAGGRGGGVVWIEADTIIWGGSGLITANGSNGAGPSVGGGSGGGGGGGFIQVVYKSKTGSSTLQVNKGNSGGISYDGGNGADGLAAESQVE